MTKRFRLCISALAILLALMVPAALLAQETTAAMRVTVYGPDGNPLEGVSVTTTDTRTGNARTGLTNESGIVAQRGLPVGGPYSVETASTSHTNEMVSDINLALGDTYTLVLQLSGSAMEKSWLPVVNSTWPK